MELDGKSLRTSLGIYKKIRSLWHFAESNWGNPLTSRKGRYLVKFFTIMDRLSFDNGFNTTAPKDAFIDADVEASTYKVWQARRHSVSVGMPVP